MTERQIMIEAELAPYFAELRAMLAICAETSPDHFYNKETGEDEFTNKANALAEYIEYLATLGDNELLNLRLSKRLN